MPLTVQAVLELFFDFPCAAASAAGAAAAVVVLSALAAVDVALAVVAGAAVVVATLSARPRSAARIPWSDVHTKAIARAINKYTARRVCFHLTMLCLLHHQQRLALRDVVGASNIRRPSS